MAVSLVWELIARDMASPAFTRVAGAADEAAVATSKAQGKIDIASTGIGKSMLKMGAAFAGFEVIKDATSNTIDFQKAMTTVGAQLNISKSQISSASKALLGIANKTATSNVEDLATSYYHAEASLRKLGATTPQVMKVVQTAAEGAKISGSDLEDTTNSLTATMASGIVPFTQAGKAMGDLNAIVASGDMKFSDLNSALGTGLLVTMKTFGVSLQDTGAALAVYGDNNVRGAKAATQLRMAVQDLTKPAAGAADTLAKVGLTTDQLQKSMASHGLVATVELLENHLQSAGVTGSQVGVLLENAFTKRAGVGLAELVEHIPQLKAALLDQEKSANGMGAAWQRTTQTISFQWDQFTTRLKTTGIEIATDVIPAISKLVGWFTQNAAWISKTALAVAGLWVAFKGVNYAITAVKAVTTNIKLMSGAAVEGSEALTGMQKAGRLAGAAVAGVVSAEVIDSFDHLNQSSGAGAKALGVLGDAAAGAATGFMIGGGPGAVIGGVTSALTGLIGITHTMSAADKQVAQDTQAYTSALQDNNGAIDSSIKAVLAKTLADDGMVKMANQAGISLKLVTSAAEGNSTAFSQYGKALDAALASGKISSAQWFQMAGILSELNGGSKQSIALGKQQKQVEDATINSTLKNASATKQMSTDQRDAANATKNLANALSNLDNGTLNTASAVVSFEQGLRQFTTGLKQNGDALRGNTTGALANRSALIQQLQSVEQVGTAMQAQGDTAKQTATKMDSLINGLINSASAAGINRQAIMSLITQYGLMPRQINTKLNVNDGEALSQVASFQEQLFAMTSQRYTVNIATQTTGGGGGSVKAHANGGSVGNGMFVVGERGPELGFKSGANVAIMSNPDSKRYVSASGLSVPGFAKGTPKAPSQLAQMRAEFESSQHPNRMVDLAAGYFFVNGQQFSSAAQAREALREQRVQNEQARRQAQRQAQQQQRQNQRQTLLGSISSGQQALGGFMGSLSDAGTERQTFSGIVGSLRQSGASSGFIKQIQGQNAQLDAAINKRNSDATRLANAQSKLQSALSNRSQMASSVSSAASGIFDIGSATGSAGSILAQEKQSLNKITAWENGIRKLSKMGLSNAMLSTFATEGPSSLPVIQALLAASPSVFKQIVQTQSKINSTANAAGTLFAGQYYASQVNADQKSVAQAKAAEAADTKRVNQLASKIATEIGKEFQKLKIQVTVDKQAVARVVADGNKQLARNGARVHTG